MVCSSCRTPLAEGSVICTHCGKRHGSWAPTQVGDSAPSGAQNAPATFDSGLLGQKIADRYVVDSLLGKGGVGAVYKARDLILNEDVAIKVLQANPNRDPRELERFKREISTSRKITHPNVIRIHDIGMLGNEAFISMEILPGGTLSGRIEQGLLPIASAVEISIGICEGLRAAHEKGIVHRDIKPDNVLFDADGQPKLVDFGLARFANSRTRTVGFSGTPFYMSPEQADGADATTASDIYSFGVLLFEVFTGRLPFVAESIVRLIVMHTREAPPVPSSIRAEIPPEIDDVILKCLAKSPADRPRDVGKITEALRSWTPTNRANPAVRTETSQPPAKATRGAGVWTLAGGGLLALLAVAAFFHRGPQAAVPTPRLPDPTLVAVVSTPSVVSTPPAVIASPEDPAPTRVTVRATPTPAPRPSPALAVKTATPGHALVAAAAPASVHVAGDDWVMVQIDDGKPQESGTSYAIPAGRHRFRFSRADRKIIYSNSQTFEVPAGKTVEFKVKNGKGGEIVVLWTAGGVPVATEARDGE